MLRNDGDADIRRLLGNAKLVPVGPFRNEEAAIAFLRYRLVAELKPSSIWLFGSRARGNARSDSDFDLLVVMPDGLPDSDYSHQAVARPIVACGLGCDIVPVSRSTFLQEKDDAGSFLNAIVSEGREIYRSRSRRLEIAG